MRESLNDLAKRGLALLILLGAAYILFKVVLGALSFVVWAVLAVLAVVAVVWAARVLL